MKKSSPPCTASWLSVNCRLTVDWLVTYRLPTTHWQITNSQLLVDSQRTFLPNTLANCDYKTVGQQSANKWPTVGQKWNLMNMWIWHIRTTGWRIKCSRSLQLWHNFFFSKSKKTFIKAKKIWQCFRTHNKILQKQTKKPKKCSCEKKAWNTSGLYRIQTLELSVSDQLPVGLLAQLVRALHQHRRGQGFESCTSLSSFRLFFHNCISWIITAMIFFTINNSWPKNNQQSADSWLMSVEGSCSSHLLFLSIVFTLGHAPLFSTC